jgi:hypothetical protein
VTLQRPVGASFKSTPMPDTQFAGEPVPSGQNPNTNLVKLGINLTTASTGTNGERRHGSLHRKPGIECNAPAYSYPAEQLVALRYAACIPRVS